MVFASFVDPLRQNCIPGGDGKFTLTHGLKNDPWQQCKRRLILLKKCGLGNTAWKRVHVIQCHSPPFPFYVIQLTLAEEYLICPFTWQKQIHKSDSDLFPYYNEACNQSDNIATHVHFPCLHVSGSFPICATWEKKKIWIGLNVWKAASQSMLLKGCHRLLVICIFGLGS